MDDLCRRSANARGGGRIEPHDQPAQDRGEPPQRASKHWPAHAERQGARGPQCSGEHRPEDSGREGALSAERAPAWADAAGAPRSRGRAHHRGADARDRRGRCGPRAARARRADCGRAGGAHARKGGAAPPARDLLRVARSLPAARKHRAVRAAGVFAPPIRDPPFRCHGAPCAMAQFGQNEPKPNWRVCSPDGAPQARLRASATRYGAQSGVFVLGKIAPHFASLHAGCRILFVARLATPSRRP
jgi:hypothetical protein